MRRGAKTLGFTALLAIAACDSKRPELTIRSTGKPPSAQGAPVPARVAEARAQLALGNVALALETFRRAVREEPRNVDAITGLAASYDRMGRFDVSRRHYEAALAVEPASSQVLAMLAASLDLQGKSEEAAAVRGEMHQRRESVRTALAATAPAPADPAGSHAAMAPAPMVPRPVGWHVATHAPAAVDVPRPLAPTPPASSASSDAPTLAIAAARPDVPAAPVVAARRPVASVFPTAPAREVTIMLPPARPVAAAPPQPAAAVATAVPAAIPAPAKAFDSGPRLERTSMGEVALITRRAEPIAGQVGPRRAATAVRFVPLRPSRDRVAVRLLNAARVDRLAATTRTLMMRRGWSNVVIGNAATTRLRSIVLYPASLRAAAHRLAAQLGLRSAVGARRGEVTVLLGSDAPALVRRRAAS